MYLITLNNILFVEADFLSTGEGSKKQRCIKKDVGNTTESKSLDRRACLYMYMLMSLTENKSWITLH